MHKYILCFIVIVLMLTGCIQIPFNEKTDKPTAPQVNTQTAQSNTQTSQKTFENKKFGFRFTLTPEWKGLGQADLALPTGVKTLRFYVDSKPYNWPSDEYDVFYLSIYPAEWWVQNAGQPEEDGSTYYKESVEKNAETYIGQYVGQNNAYAFVFAKGQSCPNTLENGDIVSDSKQCKLYDNIDNLMKSFELFNI